MRPFAIAGLLAIACAGRAWAGLYSPDEPFHFEIDSQGFAQALQFQAGFESILKEYRQVGIAPRTPTEEPNSADA